jgi:hypothetical protein
MRAYLHDSLDNAADVFLSRQSRRVAEKRCEAKTNISVGGLAGLLISRTCGVFGGELS